MAREESVDVNKSRKFVNEVKRLAKKYNLNFFVVTDGASAISNNGNEAVKHARDAHIEWEKQHNIDSEHDWSKNKGCKECAKEHRQLAKWLRELKQMKGEEG